MKDDIKLSFKALLTRGRVLNIDNREGGILNADNG